MRRNAAGFDWDSGNIAKCCKHGVTIDDIETVMSDAPRVAPDLLHSASEPRFIAVGKTATGRPIFVAFTIRDRSGQSRIRPISARFMHAKEAERYEKDLA